jgi:hypothetical protein
VWQEEGGLARELEALQTGWRLGMHDLDWESLLGLAHRYGWKPSEGSDHYLLLLEEDGSFPLRRRKPSRKH